MYYLLECNWHIFNIFVLKYKFQKQNNAVGYIKLLSYLIRVLHTGIAL